MVNLEKKVWQNGQQVGTCRMNFRIENSSYIKQMNSFTNTEDGIINMAYYESYAGDSKKKKTTHKLEEIY